MGRSLIYLGQLARRMALLDEAMVAVTAREVSPTAVGDLYCTVIAERWGVVDVAGLLAQLQAGTTTSGQ